LIYYVIIQRIESKIKLKVYMKRIFKSQTVAAGLAIFSMFFGAGNVVFPLQIGRLAGDKNIFAIFGLLVTAICVPFLGLFATILFNGDYKKFFYRIGRIPGLFAILSCMALIGPFAALPRCISLSYSTLKIFMPGTSLFIFSLISCIVLFVLAVRKSKIVDILGRFLSPVLLISLAIIIIKGFISSPSAPALGASSVGLLKKGFVEGYNTMDMLATFFFSGVVISSLMAGQKKSADGVPSKKLIAIVIKAGIIGVSLLGLVYVGFSYVSSFFANELVGVASDSLISAISIRVLGPYGGIIANVAVALACLTTAVTLAIVFAEFIQKELFGSRVKYSFVLLITLVIAFAVSNLGFSGIMTMIAPVLAIWYPGLLVLSVLNILYKLIKFKPVKIPVLATVAIAVVGHLIK